MLNIPIVAARDRRGGPLLPIGGGYIDTFAGFAETALACAKDSCVEVVVLPTAYSSDPESITQAERARNLRDAETRRMQIEAACQRAAPQGVICRARVAPIFTRADAYDPAKYGPLLSHVSAIFMLGGDQTVAMSALAGSPAEDAMKAAHRAGAAIGGTSAGGSMLSTEMMGGYRRAFGAANSLDVGAADIWNTAEQRGLAFGVSGALVDQHFFQRGRLGRLLNAITTPGAPAVGIGIDAYTGVRVDQGAVLHDVFGLYEVAVLDAATYRAAESAQYTPLEDPSRAPALSLRNVLVHLLAPGNFSFDVAARRSSLGAPPRELNRSFDFLRLPPGAGTLLLAGDLRGVTADDAILARFRELAGGLTACVLVCADGYDSERVALAAAERFAGHLGIPAEVRTSADVAVDPSEISRYSAVALIGRDQSRVDVEALARWLPDLWGAGVPVLADDAMAAVLGAYYSAHGPTPFDRDSAEAATQRSFRAGETKVRRGLNLVHAMFEPQVLADNRWGRLFSLACTRPDLVAVGLNRGAALEIGHERAWALGENVTLTLDVRAARLDEGRNGGFVVANGLLDVFAPGDEVVAQSARAGELPAAYTLLPRELPQSLDQ